MRRSWASESGHFGGLVPPSLFGQLLRQTVATSDELVDGKRVEIGGGGRYHAERLRVASTLACRASRRSVTFSGSGASCGASWTSLALDLRRYDLFELLSVGVAECGRVELPAEMADQRFGHLHLFRPDFDIHVQFLEGGTRISSGHFIVSEEEDSVGGPDGTQAFFLPDRHLADADLLRVLQGRLEHPVTAFSPDSSGAR